MSDVLNVKVRSQEGTRDVRRLRRTGVVPAVLYGHKEANVSLQIPAGDVMAVVRHGGKVVALKGDVVDNALVRSVQWDTFGTQVLHLDLMRVSASERVRSIVAVDLRGTAPGVSEGGSLQHVAHEIEIECPALSVPDHLTVSVNDLRLGKAIHASEVALPEGAKLLSHPDAIIVQCVLPHAAPEAEAGAPSAIEPELIRKEKAAEGEEE